MKDMQLKTINAVSGIVKPKVYFEEKDGKWHIGIANSYKVFNTQEEAEAEADTILKVDILRSVATTLGFDYGYDNKKFTIMISGK